MLATIPRSNKVVSAAPAELKAGTLFEPVVVQFLDLNNRPANLATGSTCTVSLKLRKSDTVLLAGPAECTADGLTQKAMLNMSGTALSLLREGQRVYLSVNWTENDKAEEAGDYLVKIVKATITGTEGFPSLTSTYVDPMRQFVQTHSSTNASTTASFPYDNTIPQITEGAPFAPLDTVFTPRSADSLLVIDLLLHVGSDSGALEAIAALFQDSGVNALATADTSMGAYCLSRLALRYIAVAGSVAARTYKVRFGSYPSPRNVSINRSFSNASQYGGTLISSLTITEYAP